MKLFIKSNVFFVMFLVLTLYFSPFCFADGIQDPQVVKDVSTNYGYYLNKLGYFYSSDSYDYCLNLRNAVVRFQADENLMVDGEFGPISLSTLVNRFTRGNTDVVYRDIVTSAPSEGYWITINLTTRALTLYNGINVVKKYPIAVGAYDSSTPTGKFKIVIKQVDPYWGGGGYAKPVEGGAPNNPLGKRWMGLSLGGGGRYGIHGNASPYSIGNNISHGCIRMINSDVVKLYGIVPTNTIVWIGSQQTLNSWGIKYY